LIWTCKDLTSESRDPDRVPKTPKKLFLVYVITEQNKSQKRIIKIESVVFKILPFEILATAS